MQKSILKEKPFARNCCNGKVKKNHERLLAEGRDHLVPPDTGPDSHYRNSSHRSGDLHKQGYPDCLSGIQCAVLASNTG